VGDQQMQATRTTSVFEIRRSAVVEAYHIYISQHKEYSPARSGIQAASMLRRESRRLLSEYQCRCYQVPARNGAERMTRCTELHKIAARSVEFMHRFSFHPLVT